MRYMNRSYLAKWLVIGILIGLVAGFGATAFYYAIELVSNTILTGLTGFSPPTPNGEVNTIVIFASSVHPKYYLIPISTIIGGIVAGLLIYRFAPEAEGHGTDAAIDAYHNKNGVVRKRIPVIKTIASAFTIGTGGSAGREGPTAQKAAGFGSMVGGLFKLPAKDRRIAVAAGIGAGIGTIFRSPFGGAVLAGEILYSGPDIEAEALIPAFIATPIGYVIFASFTSFNPIFGFVSYNFNQPDELLVFALLGALCAGFGRLYTFFFYGTKKFFDKFRISNYFKPMIGAGIAGTVAIFFPQLTGLGYGFVQILISGNTIYHNQVLSRSESPAHRGEYSIPLMTTLKVEDAMKKDLITLSPNGTAEEAFRIMSDKKIQGIPVISQDRHIQGIVTMSDVMRVPHDALRSTSVGSLMTKNVISVYPDDTLLVALEKLTQHAIGRLPVIDKETKEIVGIVSRTDLFSTYEKNIAR